MSDSESEGRPEPIRAIGGSEDEDGSDRDDTGKQTKHGAAPDQAAPADEKPSKKSSSRRRPAFSENNLMMEKGLRRVYKEFPQKCQYKGRGREAEFLRGLMFAYKEWGHQLFPALAFEDLASRTEKLGGKVLVRDLMREMRDEERDRFLKTKYGRASVGRLGGEKVVNGFEEGNTGAVAVQRNDEHEPSSKGRYTDIGEEDPRAHKRKHEGVDDGRTATAMASSSMVISSEVRERMEANRRLALERLRLKKQEAAASAAAEIVAPARVDLASQGNPNHMPSDEEVMALMDVDPAEQPRGGNGVEDDEAVLEEMEAEAEVRSQTKPATVTTLGVANSTATVAITNDPVPHTAATASLGPEVIESTALDGSASSLRRHAEDSIEGVSIRSAGDINSPNRARDVETVRKEGSTDGLSVGGNRIIDLGDASGRRSAESTGEQGDGIFSGLDTAMSTADTTLSSCFGEPTVVDKDADARNISSIANSPASGTQICEA